MNPTLYSKIYGKGVDKQTVKKYAKYVDSVCLYHPATDHVWRN